jgi:hypothetical protein
VHGSSIDDITAVMVKACACTAKKIIMLFSYNNYVGFIRPSSPLLLGAREGNVLP